MTYLYRDGAWRRLGRPAIAPPGLATVETYTRPTGAPAESTKYAVAVDGDPTVCYPTPDGHITNWAFTGGAVRVTVTHDAPITQAVVRPLRHGITAEVDGNTATFTITEPQCYALEVNGDKWNALYLGANPLLPKPNPGDVTYYYGPGYYEGTTPDGGWLAGQNLVLGDGESVYIDGGAYFRGHVNLGAADGVVQTGPRRSGISVTGYGVIDSSPHASLTSAAGRPAGITQVQDAVLSGPTLLGVTHWGCIIAECDGVTLDHTKMLNWAVASGDTPDGIDVIGSSRVFMSRGLLRAHDDATALKTFKRGFGAPSPNGWAGSVETIHYDDMLIVNGDGGNGVEIGYENFATRQDGVALTRVPQFIRDIAYRRCDIAYKWRDPNIMYRMAGIGIHLVDRVPLSGVLYEDFTVEEIITGQFALWFGAFSTGDYSSLPDYNTIDARAPISDVTLRRVSISTGSDVLPIHLQGGGATKPIDGITFEDFVVNGHHVTGPGSVAGKYTWEESNVVNAVYL